MSFDRCPKCGEYAFLGKHKCLPEWEAILVDYDEDDPGTAFGFDADNAAESYAEHNFASWDYPEEMEIWVRKAGEEWE